MKFYFKLAATNLKADRRLFVPFVITTSFLMAINLIMLNAYTSSDVLFHQFGQAAGKSLFSFGSMTTAIISPTTFCVNSVSASWGSTTSSALANVN